MSTEKDISMTNTKKEILEAYGEVIDRLQAKDKIELKPEKIVETKKVKEVIAVADSLSSEGTIASIDKLKNENNKMLNELSENLDNATDKYRKIKEAIDLKSGDLKEIYDIETSAHTLAALIEAQNKKREDFTVEMENQKRELTYEVESLRSEWKKEKAIYTEAIKERDVEDTKRRKREKEEYNYSFEREKELSRNSFEDDIEKLERDMAQKKEDFENNLSEKEKNINLRESSITEKENELKSLKQKEESFPNQLDSAVNKAVEDITEKLTNDFTAKENLLTKEAEGEKKVMLSKIEGLEKTVKEQSLLIEKLTLQTEKSFQKVQDIAIKAVESSSSNKMLNNIEQIFEKNQRQVSKQDH